GGGAGGAAGPGAGGAGGGGERQRPRRDGVCSAASAAAWTARAAARSARGLSDMDRRCRFVLSHRLCSCFVVIARSSLGWRVIVLSSWRLRANSKAPVAGAAPA